MTICRFRIVLAVLGLVAVSGPASANIWREMSREEKFSAAELIAIATPAHCPPPGKGDDYAPCSLHIIETIKGAPMTSVTFERYSIIAEEDVVCCERSHAYLAYPRRWSPRWKSVNGRFGVRDLGPVEKAK